ncbi:MAG: LysM peptidoglycan-binding domain-containing protein [Phaeodactylibacter sp.]|uniref:lytic transglycosylase n=1 Tax=Phaeodactylibacter sp. TaxID=1940289 RepID=UPI0032EBC7F5
MMKTTAPKRRKPLDCPSLMCTCPVAAALLKMACLFAFLSLPKPVQATGDSLSYLTPKDTIFLSVGQFDEKYFSHYLEPRQTLFSLAKFYGLSLQELYFHNPGLSPQTMRVGMPVRIPIPKRAIERYQEQELIPGRFAPVYYVVRKGDTLYKISKSYFDIPMEEIMMRNGLLDHTLKRNQTLHIGWLSLNGVPDSLRAYAGGELGKRNAAYRKLYQYDMANDREREHQGVAFWPKDMKGEADLMAMHRKAEIGSVISIYNPMSRRTIYAKVVGRIPDTVYKDDVVVVVSPLVARLLGAIDPRFFVKVKYHR